MVVSNELLPPLVAAGHQQLAQEGEKSAKHVHETEMDHRAPSQRRQRRMDVKNERTGNKLWLDRLGDLQQCSPRLS
jgi:hypothetical protein